MCIRLAEITSDVYLNLLGNPPKEWLALRELWYGVKSISAKYIESIQQSDQNQIIEFEEFQLNHERQYDLSAIVGKGVPAWMERRTSDQDDWEIIPVYNLHNLEKTRTQGRKGCAFFGDIYGGFQVRFTYADNAFHRIWFDPESAFDLTKDDDSILPRNFNYMLQLEVAQFVMPTLMDNAVDKSSPNKPISAEKFRTWNLKMASWEKQLQDWKPKWETWLKRSRGAQTSGNRPRNFRQNLYR